VRIGIMRIFGPFSRDFFVPWNEITVTRRDRFLWKEARLSFGQPSNGNLKVFAEVADRMAQAAGSKWPEQGSFPPSCLASEPPSNTCADVVRTDRYDHIDPLSDAAPMMDAANFSIDRSSVRAATYLPKKWGMGSVPYSGRIVLDLVHRSPIELILLGKQDSLGICNKLAPAV
jgi:hypothetical protein